MQNRITGIQSAGLVMVSAAVLCLFPSPAPGDDAKKSLPAEKTKQQDASTPAPKTSGGAMVFVDPMTREIRQPDASEIRALTSSGGVGAQGVVQGVPAPGSILLAPGGAIGIVLDPSTMAYSVATRQPDGKVSLECVTGALAAAKKAGGDVKTPRREARDVR